MHSPQASNIMGEGRPLKLVLEVRTSYPLSCYSFFLLIIWGRLIKDLFNQFLLHCIHVSMLATDWMWGPKQMVRRLTSDIGREPKMWSSSSGPWWGWVSPWHLCCTFLIQLLVQFLSRFLTLDLGKVLSQSLLQLPFLVILDASCLSFTCCPSSSTEAPGAVLVWPDGDPSSGNDKNDLVRPAV